MNLIYLMNSKEEEISIVFYEKTKQKTRGNKNTTQIRNTRQNL